MSKTHIDLIVVYYFKFIFYYGNFNFIIFLNKNDYYISINICL